MKVKVKIAVTGILEEGEKRERLSGKMRVTDYDSGKVTTTVPCYMCIHEGNGWNKASVVFKEVSKQ